MVMSRRCARCGARCGARCCAVWRALGGGRTRRWECDRIGTSFLFFPSFFPSFFPGNVRPINVPDRRLEEWVVHQTDVYLQVNPAIDKMDHEQEAVYKQLKPEKGVMNHWGML